MLEAAWQTEVPTPEFPQEPGLVWGCRWDTAQVLLINGNKWVIYVILPASRSVQRQDAPARSWNWNENPYFWTVSLDKCLLRKTINWKEQIEGILKCMRCFHLLLKTKFISKTYERIQKINEVNLKWKYQTGKNEKH